jgi:hypothetical protein
MRINDNEHISRIGLGHETLRGKTDEDIDGKMKCEKIHP